MVGVVLAFRAHFALVQHRAFCVLVQPRVTTETKLVSIVIFAGTAVLSRAAPAVANFTRGIDPSGQQTK
jgi:hypothetical protein